MPDEIKSCAEGSGIPERPLADSVLEKLLAETQLAIDAVYLRLDRVVSRDLS